VFDFKPTAVLEDTMPPKKPKRSRGRPKSGKPPLVSAFSIKGSQEWRDWVMALASYSNMPASVLIDQALKMYAKANGYDDPMPKRQTGGDQ
jgi:hypothetical protein